LCHSEWMLTHIT